MDDPRILFTASSGGHFEQLMMMKPLMEEFSSLILTEKTGYATRGENIRFLRQVNRRELRFIPDTFVNIVTVLRIFHSFKPDVIVSTGALATVPVLLLGKLFRKKIIFIESYAKTTSRTMTGKLAYKIADKFYVQWPTMKKQYPNAEFKGALY